MFNGGTLTLGVGTEGAAATVVGMSDVGMSEADRIVVVEGCAVVEGCPIVVGDIERLAIAAGVGLTIAGALLGLELDRVGG